MFPVPEALQLERALAVHVQVAPVSAGGTVSSTEAPNASDGPPFETTIVYVSGVPGTADVLPSVLEIERSTSGASVSVSVAESLPALVSVSPDPGDSVAVFERLARASAAIVPVSV